MTKQENMHNYHNSHFSKVHNLVQIFIFKGSEAFTSNKRSYLYLVTGVHLENPLVSKHSSLCPIVQTLFSLGN